MMRTPEHIPSAVHAPHRSPRGVHDVRLRHVVGAIFLATMAVLAGALYTVARTMLHAGFGEVERRETIRNIERARGALEQTLASMSSKVSDWAAWDDTCRFIVDGNQAYIDSNLTPASLANLNIESILFFDVDGRLVNATVIDAHTSDSSDLPAGLVDALTAAGLHHHEDESSALTRILLVDNTPYLIASRPIITSENTGPVRGATVFVRRLSEELIAEFAQRTHVDVGIYPLTAPDVPPDCLAAVPSLHSESNFVSPLDHHRIAGYTMLFDANGAPGLVLRIHTGRDVYQQGLASMRWIIAALILVGIGVGACTLVLIDRLVISRLVRMSAMVERIGEGDDNVILPENGVGELGVLSSSINRMVNALTTASSQLASRAEELKLKTEQLDLSRRAAEAANRAKTEFLANMSHEIRTPMTAVLGYTDLLMEPDLPDADRLAHLRMIHAAGHSLLSIINDILDISKIEAGHLSVEQVQMSPSAVVADVVSLLRAKAADKDISLVLRSDTPIPTIIHSDPVRLRQILLNIVGNAIKFTPRGEVTIALSAKHATDAHAAVLAFEITDTGPGIPPEQLERLFKPFSQADSSTARRYGGTGLGLCISMRLAEALGGTISVASTVGAGSSFTVTINPGPVERVEWSDQIELHPSRVERRPARPAATTLSGRILVADDMAENQRLISLFLRKAGAELDVVENGAEALNAAIAARDAGRPYELIILDMQMPVMDGYTAAARLRAAGFECPIIALTAFALSGEREKCLAAGCDDFATKPIDRATFIRACASWMEDSESAASESSAA